MASNIPECPLNLKQIQTYLKIASEHDTRDVVIAYWCRLYSLQLGLKVTGQQPEDRVFLIKIMDWLETVKKQSRENESITNEVAAQAYLENYALKLFMFADRQDRESNFGKNVVKAFYTAGMIYDVMLTFGELTDEVQQNRKYAKWKASYIHNCLKNGETPVPGPAQGGEDELELMLGRLNQGEQPEEPENQPPSMPTTSHIGFTPYVPPPNTNPSDPDSDAASFKFRAPSPPKEPDTAPGGFQAFVPTDSSHNVYVPVIGGGEVNITPEHKIKAQKYCKWAGSALTYDDVQTALDNLKKAVHLLETGQDV